MTKSMKADEIKGLIAELADFQAGCISRSYEYGLYERVLEVLNGAVEATYTTNTTRRLTQKQVEVALDKAIGSVVHPIPNMVPTKIVRDIQMGMLTNELNSLIAQLAGSGTSMTANQMLDSVRASLREWPNGACDVEIGKEVTRIIKEASGTKAAPLLTAEEFKSCIFTFADGGLNFAVTRDRVNNLMRQKALRQSAAPSGGATLWNAAKERERLAMQIAEDLMAQNMLEVPCVNAFHVINATLFAQESKTGAVTETK